MTESQGADEGVFVSYNDSDRDLVQPVVMMLRTTTSYVFFGPDSVKPGDRWESKLRDAIQQCEKMFVFWCKHSLDSEWVQREYMLAIDLNKKLIPVILDSTPLPGPLSEYQGIDARDMPGHEQTTTGDQSVKVSDRSPEAVASDKSRSMQAHMMIGVLPVVVIGFLIFFTFLRSNESSQASIAFWVLVIAGALVLLALFKWLTRILIKPAVITKTTPPDEIEIAQHALAHRMEHMLRNSGRAHDG